MYGYAFGGLRHQSAPAYGNTAAKMATNAKKAFSPA